MKLSKMASGNLCLTLSEEVDWDQFEEYADKIINLLKAKVKKKNESVVTIIWDILIDDQPLKLVYDDYPLGVTIESDGEDGDKKILEIFEILKNYEKI